MRDERKILIDTDLGDDIDDVIAIFAAMQRGFDLVGVTTVFRNTVERAHMAKKLLGLYGQGYECTPVFAGYGDSITGKSQEYGHVPHFAADAEAYQPDGTDPEDAIDFIIHACREYGKELTVVAIGPFTNLARVIEKDPEALKLCGKVCIMGGAFFKQYADWNVMCDVEAADMLFRSLDNLECIGADVTHLCEGLPELYNALFNAPDDSPARKYLAEMCELWRADRPGARLLLHDPLVIYHLVDPSLCGMQSITAAVITEGFARGMTLNVNAYGKKRMNEAAYAGYPMKLCKAARNVDVEKLNNLICGDFSK